MWKSWKIPRFNYFLNGIFEYLLKKSKVKLFKDNIRCDEMNIFNINLTVVFSKLKYTNIATIKQNFGNIYNQINLFFQKQHKDGILDKKKRFSILKEIILQETVQFCYLI